MPTLGLEDHIVDRGVYDNTVQRFREQRVLLPTFAELAEPRTIPAAVRDALASVDPDDAHPLNLFRVHWYNGPDRGGPDRGGLARVPAHVVLGEELTGVPAKIVVVLGDRFPLIRTHKVLAAYACLAPRVITGQFDPTAHRAVWPSTGNYCRGGVAISRLMGCRGVAILPEGMSRERFTWLADWVSEPGDVIATPGSESNVKEIYDKCAELSADPENVIFNQFSEFGNHLVHWQCTGRALAHVFEHLREDEPTLRLAAFVSASGSAGTLGAGDHLKDAYGTRIVAAEALECPTMLRNGFGEHNIQGIGDKHVPLIHNVMETDVVAAVTDRATDQLNVLFNTDTGRRHLVDRRGVDPNLVAALSSFGLSSICNVLASIKYAKYHGLSERDAVVTVATDGASMYGSERDRVLRRDFPHGFDELAAAEVFAEHVLGATTDHLRELDRREREKIFNLGYFTWVEQQGVSIDEFSARKSQTFWRDARAVMPTLDERIREFNARTGVTAG